MSKPPRNKPCPCGSGRKAKWCCIIKDEIIVARARQAVFAKIRESYIDHRRMTASARKDLAPVIDAMNRMQDEQFAPFVEALKPSQPEPAEL